MGAEKCLPINSAISLARIVLSSLPLILFLLNLVSSSSGLRLTSMNAPIVADVREEMKLDCHFDMGNEELYAVKWYKDDQEFFRYMPRLQPDTMVFPVAGVHLVPHGSNCSHDHCQVKLWKLTRDHSGGAYRCEISSEAPAFRLASETHNVTVAALPRQNPRIEGLTSSYMEGDTVAAKCVSDLSDPAPILSWYINGHLQTTLLKTVSEAMSSEPNGIGLVYRSNMLSFSAERKHSRGDSIELRCESALPGVPLPPQVSTVTIPLRSHVDPQVINNQKLHWYSSSMAVCLDVSRTMMLIICVVRWRWFSWFL